MGWLLQQDGWTVLHLPAIAEKENDPVGRKIGEALWPSHYPVESLDAIRANVGSRVFQCLYQGNVAASQGTIFKRDWFRHYTTPPESFKRIVQSWDTSFKAGATNDYSVCATIGEAQNGFYLLSLYREKVEFPELKRQVAQQADFWKPSEIYVENRASGQSLVQELKLSTSYPVIAIEVDKDKETRASATTGYYESGRVFFPEGVAWVATLEDELASFPGGLYDDCVDAISQALNRLRDSDGELTWVERIKQTAKEIAEDVRDAFGNLLHPPPKPKPVTVLVPKDVQAAQARVEGYERLKEKPAKCEVCGIEAVGQHPDGHFKSFANNATRSMASRLQSRSMETSVLNANCPW
jgi:predicted phage terminase large subunit-like protein